MARPEAGLSEAVSEENVEQQRMELETLLSIYYDKIKVIQDDQEFMVRKRGVSMQSLNMQIGGGLSLTPCPLPSYTIQVETTPVLSEPVQLVLPQAFPRQAAKPDGPVADDRLALVSDISHLSPIVLYVHYHPRYPSECAPSFHVSARWLDSKAVAFVSTKLKQCFTAESLVVFDWISWLRDDFLHEYRLDQSSRRPTLDSNLTASAPDCPARRRPLAGPPLSAASSLEATSSEHAGECGVDEGSVRHPCQIFLRSSSQLNDLEEFDQFECHKEFLEREHECEICFVTSRGTEFCEPCAQCRQLFCKACMQEYCRVSVRHVPAVYVRVILSMNIVSTCYTISVIGVA